MGSSEEIKYIADIKALISECYSDNEPLTESQKASKQCFINYCDSIKTKLQAFDLIKNSVNVLFDDTSKEIILESKNDDLEYVFILNSDTLGSRLYDEQYESMKKTLK